MKDDRLYAFTLIELLIVVAIIGILAAIAVPNFMNAQHRAKLSRVYGNLKSARTAIGAYAVDYGAMPIDMGPDAETGGTYIPLTTPTAYLSGWDAFRDPFFTGGEEDTGPFAAYGGPLHIGRFDDHGRIALFKETNIGYFIFVWGPDRAPNWPWPKLSETLHHMDQPWRLGINGDGGMFYNPSNGLYSVGDIVATPDRIYQ